MRRPIAGNPNNVDQSDSSVGGDQVAGNKEEHHHHYGAERAANVVEQLLLRLRHEMENNEKCLDIITRLQRFHTKRASAGVSGLEAKLEKAGRESEIEAALERKEMFAKLLEEWSLYASAQEIFVYLLARAEQVFNDMIFPEVGKASIIETNTRITKLIVEPTVAECGASIFAIDNNVAMGLVYWLAEQCFIRWHE